MKHLEKQRKWEETSYAEQVRSRRPNWIKNSPTMGIVVVVNQLFVKKTRRRRLRWRYSQRFDEICIRTLRILVEDSNNFHNRFPFISINLGPFDETIIYESEDSFHPLTKRKLSIRYSLGHHENLVKHRTMFVARNARVGSSSNRFPKECRWLGSRCTVSFGNVLSGKFSRCSLE